MTAREPDWMIHESQAPLTKGQTWADLVGGNGERIMSTENHPDVRACLRAIELADGRKPQRQYRGPKSLPLWRLYDPWDDNRAERIIRDCRKADRAAGEAS